MVASIVVHLPLPSLKVDATFYAIFTLLKIKYDGGELKREIILTFKSSHYSYSRYSCAAFSDFRHLCGNMPEYLHTEFL